MYSSHSAFAMVKRKAWPEDIASDRDVAELDALGRYITCGRCTNTQITSMDTFGGAYLSFLR